MLIPLTESNQLSRSTAFVMSGSVAPGATIDRDLDAGERSSKSSRVSRQVIADTLRTRNAQEQELREQEQLRREAQDEFTKSVVKIMHSDSNDFDQVASQTRASAEGCA